jgi:hypothetical protein
MNLLFALSICGESKELKLLEEEIRVLTSVPLRPRPNDFEDLDELGIYLSNYFSNYLSLYLSNYLFI